MVVIPTPERTRGAEEPTSTHARNHESSFATSAIPKAANAHEMRSMLRTLARRTLFATARLKRPRARQHYSCCSCDPPAKPIERRRLICFRLIHKWLVVG